MGLGGNLPNQTSLDFLSICRERSVVFLAMHHIKFDGFFEVCMLAFARSPPFHSIFYLPYMKNSLISEICSYHLPHSCKEEEEIPMQVLEDTRIEQEAGYYPPLTHPVEDSYACSGGYGIEIPCRSRCS